MLHCVKLSVQWKEGSQRNFKQQFSQFPSLTIHGFTKLRLHHIFLPQWYDTNKFRKKTYKKELNAVHTGLQSTAVPSHQQEVMACSSVAGVAASYPWSAVPSFPMHQVEAVKEANQQLSECCLHLHLVWWPWRALPRAVVPGLIRRNSNGYCGRAEARRGIDNDDLMRFRVSCSRRVTRDRVGKSNENEMRANFRVSATDSVHWAAWGAVKRSRGRSLNW